MSASARCADLAATPCYTMFLIKFVLLYHLRIYETFPNAKYTKLVSLPTLSYTAVSPYPRNQPPITFVGTSFQRRRAQSCDMTKRDCACHLSAKLPQHSAKWT